MEKSTSILLENEITSIVIGVSKIFPFSVTCLPQSLVLWRLLNERNYAANIHLGVIKTRDEFRAHAWVTNDNIPLNDTRDTEEQFELLYSAGKKNATWEICSE